MTPAVLLAALAGVAAAAGIVELAQAPRRVRRRPRSSPTARLLGELGRRLGSVPAAPTTLQSRMDAAGSDASVADVMAVKCGAALAAPLALLPFLSAFPGRLGPVALLGSPLAGFVAPDLVLRRRARARAAAMALEVADVADLLRVATEAGLAPGRALGEVGRRRGGLLGAELLATSRRMALGEPRVVALRRLGARAPLPAVRATIGAIERADRHGAPLGLALEAVAVEARGEHARRLEESAAKAAPKVQLVVALLLVPATLLLVAAGLAHALL